MMDNAPATGFFGKIPSHGDFIQRNLDDAFVTPWMEWQQAIIGVSREQKEQRWLETYLTSPVWRFAIPAGVLGDQAKMGVWMPSVDRVGRYFPFTIATPTPLSPIGAYLHGAKWYDQAEDYALACLGDDFCFEGFVDAINQLSASIPPSTPQNVGTTANTPDTHKLGWVFRADQLPAEPQGLEVLSETLAQHTFGCHSLWWTAGSDDIQPCVLLCQGLPSVGKFVALLDGQWHQWGWHPQFQQAEN